jgi:hypothetical protein
MNTESKNTENKNGENKNTETKSKNSECKEFNNLKYRTMINTGTNLENNVDTSEDTINNFLNMDIESNKKGMWSKLTKTEKIKKIKSYINDKLKPEYNLTEEETASTLKIFNLMIERKKLSKNTELSYNQDNGFIEQISGLTFNQDTRKFIINQETNKNSKTKKIK